MSEATKQKRIADFQIGDKVVVTKVRDGLGRKLGDTATVIRIEHTKEWFPENMLLVRWDVVRFPENQRCYPDQFEIVTQIKAMDDTREYLETINALTERSSNG